MRLKCLVQVGFGILILVGSVRAELKVTPPTPVTMAMEDQYQRPRQLTDYRGHVVVLIYGDKASADANKTVGSSLHLSFHPTAANLPADKAPSAPVTPCPGRSPEAPGPNVITLPVACVGKVPALVRTIIRNQIRRGSPYMPVWLDFEDQLRASYPFQAGVPNVLILDTQGRLRYTASGAIGSEQLGQMTRAIQELRQEAVPEK